MVRRAKAGALIVIALACNSFCRPLLGSINKSECLYSYGWPRCCASHQRSVLFPLGNMALAFVAKGNKLASRMALVIWYAVSSAMRILLEQPQHSAAELHPRLDEVFQGLTIFKSGMWGGYYSSDPSQSTPKRHWLYSNDRMMLERIFNVAGRMTADQLAQLSGPALTTRKRNADGKLVWSGVKKTMSASQCLGCYEYMNLECCVCALCVRGFAEGIP